MRRNNFPGLSRCQYVPWWNPMHQLLLLCFQNVPSQTCCRSLHFPPFSKKARNRPPGCPPSSSPQSLLAADQHLLPTLCPYRPHRTSQMRCLRLRRRPSASTRRHRQCQWRSGGRRWAGRRQGQGAKPPRLMAVATVPDQASKSQFCGAQLRRCLLHQHRCCCCRRLQLRRQKSARQREGQAFLASQKSRQREGDLMWPKYYGL